MTIYYFGIRLRNCLVQNFDLNLSKEKRCYRTNQISYESQTPATKP